MATNHSTSFDDVKSRQALADKINCDVKALDFVVIKTPEVLCSKNGCPFPSVGCNQGCCVCCSQSWYPKAGENSTVEFKTERGHLLLGPEFSRRKCPSGAHACDCDNQTCVGIGHCNDMFGFPSKAQLREQWYHTWRITSVFIIGMLHWWEAQSCLRSFCHPEYPRVGSWPR
jgi:hypothetical protein